MTINTQVHLDDGTKSTDTMCEKPSKGNKPNKRRKLSGKQREKSQAARRDLIALSKLLKEEQIQAASKAATPNEADAILAKNPNALLSEYYLSAEGATELKTFKQWQDSGYMVRKGEKALRVWGSPFKATKSNTNSSPDGEHDIDNSYTLYPVVPLYSNVQVEPSDSQTTGNARPVDQASLTTHIESSQHIKNQKNSYFDSKSKPANDERSKPNVKLAMRLRAMADKLEKDIDHAFSERQENTPKRIAQAAHARQKGYRSQRTQKALRALADLHEQGNVSEALKGFTSKKSVYEALALRQESVSNGYHCYYVETDKRVDDTPSAHALWSLIDTSIENQQSREARQRKINAVKLAKIPGYFPTPVEIIDRMCKLANVENSHTVLEPEAGSGAILDRVNACYRDLHCIGYEIHHNLFEIVNDTHPYIEREDFLTVSPKEVADRVLMNPPFEQLQDVDHVRHAYRFLKPGGRLVAIMSPSAFFRNDRKSLDFRNWLTACNGYAQDLPEGSFKASGTKVNTKIVMIEKQ